MASYRREVATSLAEYITLIEGMEPETSEGLWFRGQADHSWQLLPNSLRNVKPLTDGRGQPVAPSTVVNSSGHLVGGPSPERMLQAFKRRSLPFLSNRPNNTFEWMFLAQHHGLPTRLLDWSTNALIALFFGVEHAQTSNNDPELECKKFLEGNEDDIEGFSIFVIDPGQINDEVLGVRETIDISDEAQDWQHYAAPMDAGIKAFLPICVTAPHNSERIRAQSGAFTLHGSNIWPLDYYDDLRPLITKIFFPYAVVESIRKGLARIGITSSFVYSDLNSISRDIRSEEI